MNIQDALCALNITSKTANVKQVKIHYRALSLLHHSNYDRPNQLLNEIARKAFNFLMSLPSKTVNQCGGHTCNYQYVVRSALEKIQDLDVKIEVVELWVVVTDSHEQFSQQLLSAGFTYYPSAKKWGLNPIPRSQERV